VPAAALAFGLMAGLAVPTLMQTMQGEESQLPESYVGVLATAEGRTGLIVASRRQGRVLDLKTVLPVALPPGRAFVLWTLDAEGRAQAAGALPAPLAPFSHVALDRTSEDLFARAVELAVSVEAAGPPPAAPTTAFVYRGLCGKLWPPKPAR
jgi:anti-sigma-K factor RskA